MKITFGKSYFFRFLICLPLVLSFVFFAKAQQNESPLIKSETNPAQNLLVFDALWEKINTKYFDPNFNGVDWKKIREIYRPQAENVPNKTELLAIFKQMLNELKTSHLNIWQTVSKKKLEKKILKDFDPRTESLRLTYGFDFKIIEDKPIIDFIYPNSSAQLEKVQIGWQLLQANGKFFSDADFNFGEIFEGRKIDLQFVDVDNKKHNVTLTADWTVKKVSLVSRPLSEKVGYIRFEGFSKNIAKWLEIELHKFKNSEALILDLRGNSGGFVEEVKKCLGLFFSKNIDFGSFIERSGKIKDTEIKSKREKAFKGKLVVLVDDESFSGAEIFAQIVKENERGKIVGTQTRGFVLNSMEFSLPENFRVSIAFRDYLSPKGYRLEAKGVTPDFEVPVTVADLLNSRDRALEKALEIIK